MEAGVRGGMKLSQAKRLKELEKENQQLKRAVAELTLDKLILKEASEGNESIPKLVETRVTSGRSGCGMSLAIGMDDPEFLLNRGTERREVAIAE